jgi:pimeloyl-ACP methyl ester carboxylesterase
MKPRHSRLKRFRRIQTIFAGAVVFASCGCAHLASVKVIRARPPTATRNDEQLQAAKQCLVSAEREQPIASLGDNLTAAKLSLSVLEQRPRDPSALSIYNFSVARAVENVERAKIQPWQHKIDIAGTGIQYTLTSPKPADLDHDPSRYDLIPADTLKIGGEFLRTRSTVAGIGAPLVAIGRMDNPQSRQRFELERIYAPVTAFLEFRGERVNLELIDSFEMEHISIAKRQATLAADFTAPIAMAMTREHPEKLGFARLVRPERSADTGQLIRLQPYDPNRIPVILVHGLGDSFVTWAPMVNTLESDSEIRRCYQFWVYSYPSGYPYPYSAALLRQKLDAVSRTFPDHKGIVLIGHSMGGLVSRLLVTDVGNRIWRDYFGKPPEETMLPGVSRKLLEESLIFNHRSDIKRVIFISTPHRGSVLASNWIGRFGTSLVQMPLLGASVPPSVFSETMIPDSAADPLKHVPTSIDTLSPKDRFILEINRFPIAAGIPFHTIEGDRGRGDAPNSSDGVVPYWSSHLDGAQSELIVPSDHRAQRNPQAIAEVCRILKLHCQQSTQERRRLTADRSKRLRTFQ